MNPIGIILIGLGLICFIVGFKGSQHEVISAFKGVTGGSKQNQTQPGIPPNLVPNPVIAT
jgi:hypothetical protein